MSSRTLPAIRRIRSAPLWLLGGVLVALAVLHVCVTVSTVLSSTLQHPFQDQFRLNMRYLTVSFPLNVLLLENGHRPIIPGLLRYIELTWFDGKGWLQALAAWMAIVASTVMLLRDAAKTLPRLPATTCACVVASLIWWNADARMYFHPYEAVHLFFVFTAAMIAFWFAYAGTARDASYLHWCGALLAAIFATFTFGPGITIFAALFAVALLARCNVRILTTIALTASAVFVVYMFLLPGWQGISQAQREFAPGRMMNYFLARMGSPISELLMGQFDLEARILIATFSGVAVVVAGLAAVFAEWRLKRAPSRLMMVALGLFVVGAATNFLIVANRTEYFYQHPEQLLADRYLFWGCVSWLGAALLVNIRPRFATGWPSMGIALAAGIFSAAALLTSQGLSGWSAEVYRRVELGNTALALDLSDPTFVRDIADLDVVATRQSAVVMKKLRIAGYGSHIGEIVSLNVTQQAPLIQMERVSAEGVFGGQLSADMAEAMQAKVMWLVAGNGKIIGRATMTKACVWPPRRLYIGVVKRDCFEGYELPGNPPGKWLVTFTDSNPTLIAEVGFPAK